MSNLCRPATQEKRGRCPACSAHGVRYCARDGMTILWKAQLELEPRVSVYNHVRGVSVYLTTTNPRTGRSERPLSDPLNQFPSLVLRINVPQPCSDLTCYPSEWCAARPALRVPVASIRVLLMISIDLARFCDDKVSCSTRSKGTCCQ